MNILFKRTTALFFLVTLLTFISCNKDDDQKNTITVETEDFTVTINENVNNGDILGSIEGSTNQGSVIFSITNESVLGAFSIDEELGTLTVLDETLFDFNTNPTLTAIVNVANGDISANSNVVIHVTQDVIIVETEDMTFDVFENVLEGQELATVPGTTNQGNVIFEIISESVPGAFGLDTQTGLLTVANASSFNFATNPTLLVTVSVSNGNVAEQSIVTVNLLEVIVETEDLNLEVLPFPMSGEVLGTVSGTTNQGSVTFEIISESTTGAFTIDAETGILSVLDDSLYDPNINPLLTAQVKVANNDISAISNITVVVLSDCQISQQNFENFINDLINNQGYPVYFYMDLSTHEYTFSLSESATICSIGYQSYDEEKPYLFEIINQADEVLYSDNLAFSSTMQDYVSITPLLLSPGTYTIKRTAIDVTIIEELLGNIIEVPGGADFPFPMPYNSFMTFVGSDFYGGGGPSPNIGLPYISIAFE